MVIRTHLIQNLIMILLIISLSRISYIFLLLGIIAVAKIIFNKIEYDGNNTTIKYILGSTLIDINNIEGIKVITFPPFPIKKDILKINWQDNVVIYYLSPKNEKKSQTLSIFHCPGFKKIIQKILQVKPNLKVAYTDSRY